MDDSGDARYAHHPASRADFVYGQDTLFELAEKVCTRCKESKALDAFNRYARSPDGRQPHCRECSKAYYRANHEQHRKNVARRNAKLREQTRLNLLEYFATHPCVDCGETDPSVLDFDHVRGEKTAAISTLVRRRATWRTIAKEIEKCEVRCANCHRRKTARELDWYTVRETGVAYVTSMPQTKRRAVPWMPSCARSSTG